MEPTIPPQSPPIQSVTPIPPVPVKPKSNFLSVFIIIILLLSLCAVGFLVYQNWQLKQQISQVQPTPTPFITSTPTPDPTADWETYTSVKAGFSLKYPKSLPITTSICGGTCVEDLSFTPNPAVGGSSIAVVLTFKDQRIKTLNDYKNIIIKSDSSMIDVQNAKIDNEDAVSYKLSGGIPPLPIIEYTVVHNNYYYIIRLENSDETNKNLVENQNNFNQILSTFKFVDQTSDSNTNTINSLVQNFYIALGNQDGKTLFSYMTPATTSDEKSNYSWLTGADLGANASYRVFLRSKISNPQIRNIKKQSDGSYLVSITDQFAGYSNAGQTVGYTTPQTRSKISMTVVNMGGKWQVDKYTDENYLGGNAPTPKYNGFDQ